MDIPKSAPVPDKTATDTPSTEQPAVSRLSKLKAAFLYVLIAGLAAAAIVSVVALLVGEFNSVISKSLGTIFILLIHSLLILALFWGDRNNQIGKALLPTTIAALLFANMITMSIGIWEVISNDTAWHITGLYFLVLGAVFIVLGLLKLRVAHQVTQVALYSSIGLLGVTVLALVPWVLDLFAPLDPLYFRIIAALSILTTTAFIIAVIIRSIALAQNDSLKLTRPTHQSIPGGLLSVYITLGVITAMVWSGGLVGFLVSGVQSSSPYQSDSRGSERNRYY